MRAVSDDPVQALALLPLEQSEEVERQWLQNTLAWLKVAPPEARTERLRHLAEGIRKLPNIRERFQLIWVKAFPPRLFSEAGLPEATSIVRELMARLKRRLLPQLEDELDLYTALHTADLDDADAKWIAGLSDQDVSDWRELLGKQTGHFPIAMRLLAIRAAAIGLSRGVMKVMPHRHEGESPFFDLEDAAGSYARSNGSTETRQELQKVILNCRFSAGRSLARLEEEGVSSDLVFRLDLAIAQLERMDMLLRIGSGQQDAREFGSMLIRGFA